MRTLFVLAALLFLPASASALSGGASVEYPLTDAATVVAPLPDLGVVAVVTTPASAAPSAITWLRAGDPPNWQVIAVLAWLVVTALLKASSRLRANEPLELVANLLVRVPLVGTFARAWTTPGTPAPPGSSVPPAALVLALLSAWMAAPARADEPPAPAHAALVLPAADAVEMPPATVAAPVVPKFADVAACTIAAQPGVIGQCVADPGKVAPLDSRSFWMAFGGSLGTTAISVIGALVTHYLPPEPLR